MEFHSRKEVRRAKQNPVPVDSSVATRTIQENHNSGEYDAMAPMRALVMDGKFIGTFLFYLPCLNIHPSVQVCFRQVGLEIRYAEVRPFPCISVVFFWTWSLLLYCWLIVGRLLF